MMSKELEQAFIDWEGYVFGFGYGTGEGHIIPALITFLTSFEERYDHKELKEKLGASTAWLLINTLCHADIIEYGTSPRFGWLTPQGILLREFVLKHDADYLIGLVCEGDAECSKDYCNCGDDITSGCKNNPFFFHKYVMSVIHEP